MNEDTTNSLARRASGHGQSPVSTRTQELSSAAVQWIKTGISVSFALLATTLGVQLGLAAPAVSPVSPAAIAGTQVVAAAPAPPIVVSGVQAGAPTSAASAPNVRTPQRPPQPQPQPTARSHVRG
jgi:hypothetical protein